MEKEKQLLLLCRQLIEQMLNWGDSSVWGNDDFEQLSQQIFDKTRVQLSVSTLKRIWGKVRYESFPNAATLNALACFLDYTSWRDFRQHHQVNGVVEHAVEIIGPEAPQTTTSPQPRLRYVWFGSALLLVLGALFFMSSKRNKPVDPASIKFSSKKVSDDLPNSVIFNYDVSAFHSDSVFIQQSWDPNRREQVPGDGKQFTSIYYEPGYFIAKLIVDKHVKKETSVFIKTKGWKGILDHEPVPVYLSAEEIKGKGFMGVDAKLIQQKSGTPVFNNTWVKFANIREFPGINADNFTMDCTLRNTSTPGQSACARADLTILGNGTAIVIPIVNTGCISDIGILTGTDWVSGKDHDLSAFGTDMSQFQNLRCSVKDHFLRIYLNNKQIFEYKQAQTMGRIVGIRFEFEGPGEVKQYKLETPGGSVYEEQF
ncbi:hypothetical protein MTO98_19805 [Mucilaginibacter sp. SMC90]|uniref:hypothetical protein n=1 Tax=Mucilaginibacter sp. SMC90 TaxID=2929803 RepID=UPI001FB3DBA0|nr:hypothetical protein [Mucilaginibacter sp. SMC90]UOE46652.1 hypothetical protein MTO98_19805 [Mucilaginibacter sp. SMC90]